MNFPPPVLVKTWIMLIHSSESQEVKERATNMLHGAFEDMQALAEYCQKHDIALGKQ